MVAFQVIIVLFFQHQLIRPFTQNDIIHQVLISFYRNLGFISLCNKNIITTGQFDVFCLAYFSAFGNNITVPLNGVLCLHLQETGYGENEKAVFHFV